MPDTALRRGHAPRAALEDILDRLASVLVANAEFCKETTRTLQVELGEMLEAAEHAIIGGVDALPILLPTLARDERVGHKLIPIFVIRL